MLCTEVFFARLKKINGFLLQIFTKHHIKKQANKDREHNSLKLVFKLVEGQVHKMPHLFKWVLELTRLERGSVRLDEIFTFQQGLQISSGEVCEILLISSFTKVISSLILWLFLRVFQKEVFLHQLSIWKWFQVSCPCNRCTAQQTHPSWRYQ